MEEEFMMLTQGGNYLESLIRCRQLLVDNPALAAKLDIIVDMELDIARAGAEKAINELLKLNKPNLTPIK